MNFGLNSRPCRSLLLLIERQSEESEIKPSRLNRCGRIKPHPNCVHMHVLSSLNTSLINTFICQLNQVDELEMRRRLNHGCLFKPALESEHYLRDYRADWAWAIAQAGLIQINQLWCRTRHCLINRRQDCDGLEPRFGNVEKGHEMYGKGRDTSRGMSAWLDHE